MKDIQVGDTIQIEAQIVGFVKGESDVALLVNDQNVFVPRSFLIPIPDKEEKVDRTQLDYDAAYEAFKHFTEKEEKVAQKWGRMLVRASSMMEERWQDWTVVSGSAVSVGGEVCFLMERPIS